MQSEQAIGRPGVDRCGSRGGRGSRSRRTSARRRSRSDRQVTAQAGSWAKEIVVRRGKSETYNLMKCNITFLQKQQKNKSILISVFFPTFFVCQVFPVKSYENPIFRKTFFYRGNIEYRSCSNKKTLVHHFFSPVEYKKRPRLQKSDYFPRMLHLTVAPNLC